MDIQLVRKLVKLMASNDLTEFEIEDQESGLRLHLRRAGSDAPPGAPLVNVVGGAAAAPIAAAPPVAAPGVPAPPQAEGGESNGTPFLSPMVGTFYRATSPDSDPFVEVGAKINEESVVCIVEAMKVMNEIKAETKGVVTEILVENGEPVEYGQPLFLIQPL